MPAKLRERDIQRTCCELLEMDGWRRLNTDPPWLRGLGVLEKGIPDDLFLRYEPISDRPMAGVDDIPDSPLAQVVWIEWKRPKGKTAQHQTNWHSAERARGALVWVAMVDFPPTIEGFTEFYMNSGLCRKILPKDGR